MQGRLVYFIYRNDHRTTNKRLVLVSIEAETFQVSEGRKDIEAMR